MKFMEQQVTHFMSKIPTLQKKAGIKNTLASISTVNKSSAPRAKTDKAKEHLELLQDSIKGMYWVENHLIKSLPKVIYSCHSKELANAISEHLEITKQHLLRLEKIFTILGITPIAKKSDGMEGLTKEGECIIESTNPGTDARDLGIIMASQNVEHYEISAYKGINNLASMLKLKEIAEIVNQTLTEEQNADNTLSKIADKIGKKIN